MYDIQIVGYIYWAWKVYVQFINIQSYKTPKPGCGSNVQIRAKVTKFQKFQLLYCIFWQLKNVEMVIKLLGVLSPHFVNYKMVWSVITSLQV